MFKKIFALMLMLCMLLPMAAGAEQTIITDTYSIDAGGLPSNDEMFVRFVERELSGHEVGILYSVAARRQLEGNQVKMYDAMKAQIEEIAAGTRTSSIISVNTDSWAAYSVDSVEALKEAFKADFSLVLDALLADCPMDLYWYDKTAGTSMSYGYSSSGSMYSVASCTFIMSVANAYAGANANTVAVSKTTLQTVKDNAQSIVDDNADKSDLEKLKAYKDAICNLVSYNDEAADDNINTPYGDPWQLIYVFDGNPDTEVVCEGYAKAFQYLCDLSEFDDAECYTVSGVMAGGTGSGPHMWNIVRTGGKSYLVDVTNSDAGTIGSAGTLFMAKAASGGVQDGYVINGNGGTPVIFAYDSDSLWDDEDVLTLAMEGEEEAAAVADVNGTEYADFEDALANWTDGTTLSLLADVTYSKYIPLSAGASRTLDGGAYTLTLDSQQITNNGKLTINSGTFNAPTYREVVRNEGTLIINGGVFNSANDNLSHAIYNDVGATFTMNGGSLLNSKQRYAITNLGAATIAGGVVNGAYNHEGGTLTIKGTTEIKDAKIGVYNEENAVLNITGGSITASDDIINNDGTATITGGKHTGTGNDGVWNAGTMTIGGTAEIIGSGFGVYNTNDDAEATLNITGGTISATGDFTKAVMINDPVNISGGAFFSTGFDFGYISGGLNITGGVPEDGWLFYVDGSSDVDEVVVGTQLKLPANYYVFMNDEIVPTVARYRNGIIRMGEVHTCDFSGTVSYETLSNTQHNKITQCTQCTQTKTEAEAHTFTYTANDDGLTHSGECVCHATTAALPHTESNTDGKCDDCQATLLAKVGSEYYADFKEALANWTDGTTLTLLANVTYEDDIILDGNGLVLDLNRKTLDLGTSVLNNGGQLTITGGTLRSDNEYVTLDNYGTLIVNDSIIFNELTWAVNNAGTLTATYSHFTGGGGVLTNGDTVTLTGGTLYDVSLEDGEITLDGCELSDEQIYYVAGQLKIAEGTDCDGWRIICNNENPAAIGPDMDIELPAGYYAFDDDGKLVTALNGDVTIQAHTHEKTYIDNGDGTHDYGCTCGPAEKDNEKHTFAETEGVWKCACGAVAVAKVGSEMFADFAGALANWTSSTDSVVTLTLLENVTYENSIGLYGEGLKLDLNGHTLDLGTYYLQNYGTLTITGGTIKSSVEGSSILDNRGTLVIEDSNITNQSNLAVWNHGTLTATDSAFNGSGGVANRGTAVLTGCTLMDVWLENGEIILNGCKISDANIYDEIYYRTGTLTIAEGTDCDGWIIDGRNANPVYIGTDMDIVLPAGYYAFDVDDKMVTTLEPGQVVTIKAHTHNATTYTDNGNGTHDFGCACGYVTEGNKNQNHTFAETSGVWKCACGAVAVAKVADALGSEYYADFAGALANWTDGTTLTLLADVTYEDGVSLDGEGLKLDLKGKTLDLGTTIMSNEGQLTITGGTIQSNEESSCILFNQGTLVIEDSAITNLGNVAVWNDNGAELTATNSVFDGGYGINNDGTAVLTGCTLVDAWLGDGEITLNGCTLSDADGEAWIYYWDSTLTIAEGTNCDGWIIDGRNETSAAIGTDMDMDIVLPAGYYAFVDGKMVTTLEPGQTVTIKEHTHEAKDYTNNGDGTHDTLCACGFMVKDNEKHTFADANTCACGAVAVAKVNSEMFVDFADALANWTDGTTLTLLADVTYEDGIGLNGEGLKLDLNGKTLDLGTSRLSNYGMLTISGGTLQSSDESGDILSNSGTMIIKGSTITNQGAIAVWNEGTLTATNSAFNGSFGVLNLGTAELTGCTLVNVQLEGGATTLDGCTISIAEGYSEIYYWGGKLKIAGGTNCGGWTIDGRNANPVYIGTGMDIVLPAGYYAFDVDDKMVTTLEPDQVVTIKTHTHKAKDYTNNGDGTHDALCACGSVEVEEHTFPDGKPCACGAEAVAKVGSEYYADFADALDNWTDGTTLTLLAGVTYEDGIVLDGNGLVLNLNGKKLDLGTHSLANYGTLTISGGTIQSNEESSSILDNHGTLVIEGSAITNPGNLALMNDGTLTATNSAFNGSGGVINYGAAELTGCTLVDVYLESGVITLDRCTLSDANGDAWICYWGGKLKIAKGTNCDGWIIDGRNETSAAIGTDIVLATGYYAFEDGKMVTALEPGQVVTITYHPEHDSEGYAVTGETTISQACTCGNVGGASATLSAPVSPVYDGTVKPAVVTGDLTGWTLGYSTEDGEAPVHAGTYTATLTAGDASVSVEYIIKEAEYTGEKTVSGLLVKGGESVITLPALPEEGAGFDLPIFEEPISDVDWDPEDPSWILVTGSDAVAVGQTYTITIPVVALRDYNLYDITVTLTGTEHVHDWTYTADDDADIITAECVDTLGDCTVGSVDIVLNGPDDMVYDSTAKEAGYIFMNVVQDTGIVPEITYTGDQVNVTEDGFTATMTLGEASVSETYVIEPASIEGASVSASVQTYTGEALEPEVTVILGGKTLTADDYDVSYENNVNAGTAAITVTGKGNYTDTATGEFTVFPATIYDFHIVEIPDQVYTGEAIEPELIITIDGYELVLGEDYTVTYQNNTNAGTATASVTGKGNYDGETQVEFSIVSAPSDLTAETYLGETKTGVFTYGDVITVRGTVTVDNSAAFSLRSAPAANQVALYLEGGDDMIAGPVNADPTTGAFELTYDTAGQAIAIGQKNLTLAYVSDGNKQDTTGTVTVELNAKPLTVASAAAQSRVYDGTDKVTVTGVTLSGLLAGDTASVKLDNLVGAIAGANAGAYDAVTLPALALSDAGDAAFYTLTQPTAAVPAEVTITKAAAQSFTGAMFVVNNLANTYTFDLADYQPAAGEWGDTVSYALGTVNLTGGYYTNGAAISGSVLSLPIQQVSTDATGEIGTIAVTIASQNYADSTLILTVSATNHQHDWSFTAANATINAVCANTASCPDTEQSITLTAPASLVYDGAAKSVTMDGTIDGVNLPQIAYTGDRTNVTESGFTASLTLGNATAMLSAKITPKDITGAVVGAFDAMTYTGAAQTPKAAVTIDGLTVTGAWSMVTNVADTTTFIADGNFSGVIENQTTGMLKAAPVKEDFAVTLPENLAYTGESKAAAVEAAAGVAGMGAITVKYDPQNPVDAGAYNVLIDVAEGDNYAAVTDLVVGSFAITQADTAMTAQADKTAYTYGDVITVTGTAAAPKPEAKRSLLRAFAQPTAQQVALYDAAGSQLTDGVDVKDGAYTLTYDTKTKAIAPADAITLTVKFVGDDNMTNASAAIDLKLSAKAVAPALEGAAVKAYDGTAAIPADHSLSIALDGKLDGDDLSAAASYAYADAVVGANKTVTATGIALSGEDAEFYTLTADTASGALGEIIKAKLTALTAPADQTLDVYCADAAAVMAKLPATVICSVEGGGTLELDIIWSCDGYNSTPNAKNTFTWTVDDELQDCYEPESDVKTTGSITVTNPDALPVTLMGTDKSIAYDGNAYDVSAMFAIDPNAGAVSYEIVTGGTGEGTLSTCALTITKVGTFTIKLTTAAHDAYAAGEATATLTVAKGTPAVTVPANLTAVYTQKLSAVALPTDTLGVWTWENADALVGNAGEQMHKAIFTPNDQNLWNAVTADVTITVVQSATDLTGTGLNHTDGQYVYGEDIVVTLQAQASGNAAVRMLRSAFTQPQAKQMALYKRVAGQPDEQITEPVSEANGQYVLTLRTVDKLLAIGENTLVAKYVGDANAADAEAVYTVTIAKKPLTLSDVTAQNRYYFEGVKTVTITGAVIIGLESDASGLDDVQLAAGQKGTISSDAVGEYTAVTLAAPELAGEDAAWYTVEAAEYAVNVRVAEIPEDGIALQLIVKEGCTDEDVKSTDLRKIPTLDTAAEIDAALRLYVAGMGAISDNAVLYDVILEYEDPDGIWRRADKEHFPAGGIEVTLPVVKGTDPNTHTYTVAHMFTMDMNGHKAGDVEYPTPKVHKNDKGEWVLTFTVTSLSPIMVAAIPIPTLPQTGDASNILLYAMLLAISMIGITATARKRRAE